MERQTFYNIEMLTPPQVDLIKAGLGALTKRVKDRIKHNERHPENPNQQKHINSNTARLQRIKELQDIFSKESLIGLHNVDFIEIYGASRE